MITKEKYLYAALSKFPRYKAYKDRGLPLFLQGVSGPKKTKLYAKIIQTKTKAKYNHSFNYHNLFLGTDCIYDHTYLPVTQIDSHLQFFSEGRAIRHLYMFVHPDGDGPENTPGGEETAENFLVTFDIIKRLRLYMNGLKYNRGIIPLFALEKLWERIVGKKINIKTDFVENAVDTLMHDTHRATQPFICSTDCLFMILVYHHWVKEYIRKDLQQTEIMRKALKQFAMGTFHPGEHKALCDVMVNMGCMVKVPLA